MKHHPLSFKKNKATTRFMKLGDILGWIGAAMLLGAFLAVSNDLLAPDSFWFQILNLLGALFMFVLAAARHAKPSAIVNIIWAGIALFALISLFI